MKITSLLFFVVFTASSCAVSQKVSRQAEKDLLNDSVIKYGHIGISIFEPASGKYLLNTDGDKYFVPASNTKLFSLYAGMKHLGDSLIGLRYLQPNDSLTIIQGAGDPTFLHPGYPFQPILSFLKKQKIISKSYLKTDEYLGLGWGWDDYKDYYMVQRNDLPVYGNIIRLEKINNDSVFVYPHFFASHFKVKEPLISGFKVVKPWDNNENMLFYNGNERSAEVPFVPDPQTILSLLEDTLHKKINTDRKYYNRSEFKVLHSQPVDSLFKVMMHVSDNFFAEQTLLMVSNELLGIMDDQQIIDTLLNSDLKDIPQRPKWVDGSGLSRYNLFTPQDFVYILNKMKDEFGFERIKTILPTGGTGTLKNYYIAEKGFIFAKTGSLSNHIALSGFLITKKNKVLIFSVLVNHFQGGPTPVRRAVEKFLKSVRENN